MTINWQPGVTLADVEKQAIVAALRYCENNKTRAAQILGIATKTMYNKLHEYGLMEPEVKPSDGARTLPTSSIGVDSDPSNIAEKQRQYVERFRASGSGIRPPPPISKTNETFEPDGDETETGLRTESTEEVGAERTVSVRQRKKIQAVSP